MVLLDLRGKSPVAEYFVIATGTSPRQMRTVVDEAKDLGKKMNFSAWKTDGYESAKWILMDCVHVVIHVFDPDSRDFYDLEMLWGDCPRIDWRSILGLPPEVLVPRERVKPSDVTSEDAEDSDDDLYDDAEGDDESDDDTEGDEPMMIELPDESTGSNSVEFVEVESPRRRGKRNALPTPLADQDEEPSELEGLTAKSDLGNNVEEVVEEIEGQTRKLTRKASAKKKVPAKKAVSGSKKSAPAKKKPVAKAVVKKAAKKAPAKKTAAKKAAGSSVKKAAKKAVKKPAKKPAKPAAKKAVKSSVKPAAKKAAGKTIKRRGK